jgi:acyl-CoA thioesterase
MPTALDEVLALLDLERLELNLDARDGTLVTSVVQEGLLRPLRPV